jgi:hypothetical protein
MATMNARGRNIRRSISSVLLLAAIVWLAGVSTPASAMVDPSLMQQAYLKALNAGSGDQLGISIAISGDTAVVGTINEDSNATGVNGNAADNSAATSGAAYVYVRNAGVWVQQAYLKASNTEANDQFGTSVAISGDTIVVGAVGEDSNAFGVNGLQTNNSDAQAGAAYVFVRSGTTWTQQAFLKSSNRTFDGGGHQFGISVAASGDTVAVGAWGDDSGATGINGTGPATAVGSGAVYVFVRTGTAWSQQAYIKSSNSQGPVAGAGSPFGDTFGYSVALSGDTLVAGAAGPFGGGEDSGASGVNGDQSDNSVPDSGAAYVFVRTGTIWTQEAYLKASNPGANDRFGISVAVSDNTIVVGAYLEDSNATGVNGNQSDNSAGDAGAAYVFFRSGTTWTQQAYLKASSVTAGDQFGKSVAVSGNGVFVGAPFEDSNATGVDGNAANESLVQAGAAYHFMRSGTVWAHSAYVKASNTGLNDQFGSSVAMSGDTAVSAAIGEDSSATVVNGDQTNNAAADAGAAYVFVPFVSVNAAPVAQAGPDQSVPATSGSGATVTLAGTASSDADGDILTYTWREGAVVVGNASVIQPVVSFGTHTFTLTVTDPGGLASTDSVVVTVADVFTISIVTPPAAPANYFQFQAVAAAFTCSDSASLLVSCVSAPGSATLDTLTTGSKNFSVTATNSRGDFSSQARTYNVVPQTAQTISFTQPATITYGTATIALTASATSGLPVTLTSNSASVCTVSGATATILGLGTCSITATQGGSVQYSAAAPVTRTFSVQTKPVTAAVTAANKPYDATATEPNANMTCTLTGVVPADSANVLCTATDGLFAGATVGTHSITATVTLSGGASGNYTLGAAGTSVTSATAGGSAGTPDSTADFVWGQNGNFTTSATGSSATSLLFPFDIATDSGGNVYVSDSGNHRVFYYPAGSATPTRVYGQNGSFTSNTRNNGGVSATSLNFPTSLVVDNAGGLYVSDSNHRVLYFVAGSTTATRVYGQGGVFTASTLNNGGITADSLRAPGALALDAGGNLYVADNNNRVLYYPAGSTTATRVYGQSGSFTTDVANNGGVSANSLSSPRGVAVDGAGNVYIGDRGNNRVLVYPSGSTTATRVYGQNGSFTTGLVNNTNGNANVVSESSLQTPAEIAVDGAGNLYVVDMNNYRMLFYPAGSTTATAVYGQLGSFTTRIPSNGGVTAQSFGLETFGVALDSSGNVYMTDITFNRALRFNAGVAGLTASITTAPVTATLSAAGKTYDGTTAEPNASMSCTLTGVVPADASNVTCTATNGTFNLATAGSRTVTATVTISGIAAGNYTLGVAGTTTTSASKTATASITAKGVTASVTAADKTYNGNANATMTGCTLAGVMSPDTTGCATSVTAANNQFSSASAGNGKTVTANAIALTNNTSGNYALTSTTASTTANITTAAVTAAITASSKVYDSTATATTTGCTLTGVVATDVPNATCVATGGTFNSAAVGAGTVTATVTLSGTASANYTLGAAGTTVPSANATLSLATATGVYGQLGSFTTSNVNVNANGLFGPSQVALDSAGNLYIVDARSHRVLSYAPGSTTATRVYGQLGSFTTNIANNGGVTVNSLQLGPGLGGIAVDTVGNVYVADSGNHRVLFYPAGSTTATRVYGQSGSFTTGAASAGLNGLSNPIGLAIDGSGNLYVADAGNHRVLFFPANTTTPTRVYGQGGSFTTATGNKGGISANSLLNPLGLGLDANGNLFVADSLNYRVLVFANGSTTATRVYGQGGSFTTNTLFGGANSANSLNQPKSVLVDASGNLYVSELGAVRVLFIPANSTTGARVYGQLGSFTSGVALNGGLSASSFGGPNGLALDGNNNLYVADTFSRVLRFNGAPVITAAPLTVTLTAAGKTYDGTTAESNASLSCAVAGVLAADSGNVTCTATNGAFDLATAGLRTVTATITISGSAAGNYQLASSTATASATISKRAAVIMVPGYNVTFDGAEHTATGTATGVGGVNLSALLHLEGTTHTNAGDYPEDVWTFDGDANYNAATGFVANSISRASSMTTVTCSASETYTGSALTPCSVTVTGAGSLSLTPAPTYANNINVGTATASYTFGGDANHDGSTASSTFAITKAGSTTVVSCPVSETYTSAAITACTATVTGAGSLSESVAVTYTNNVNVGAATATATFGGDANHDGSTASSTFAITKAGSTTTVSCPVSETYTGAAITACTATVTGVGSLSESVAVTYTNNVNVGTATASATFGGDANHDGSTASSTFAITKAGSRTVVSCPVSETYTGAAIQACTATVTGAGSLNESVAVTYTNNVNAGTANASATFGGDANHETSTDSETFAITKAASTTVVTCPVSETYTGSAIQACTATVTGAGSLNESVAVTYANNINVGTANASATFGGDANHDGSTASSTFAITKAGSTTVVSCPVSETYTGAAITACTATVAGAGGLNESVAVTYTNNINVGTANASATFGGDANHDGSTASATFAITKAASTTVVTCPVSETYTGAAITACTATVTGAGSLNEPVAVTYTNNVNVGTANASAAFAGDANHDGSTASSTFAITKAGSTTVVTCPVSETYTGAAITTCTATVTGAGSLNEPVAVTYTNNINVGTANASATFGGDANHDGSTASSTFAITKAGSTTTVSCPVSEIYTGAAIQACTATVTGVGGLNESVAVTYTNNRNVGTATASATFAGDANHNTSTASATFAITPAAMIVTADNKSKLVGAADPALTYQVSGLKPGDTAASVLTGGLTRDAGEAAGSYAIRPGTLAANANYTLTVVNGTLTISYNTCLLYDPTKAVKSGATIPIKIKLCSATGANVSNSAVVVTAVSLGLISTSATGEVIDAGNANADGNFRFDAALGPGYIFNLKTTGLSQGTYRLEIRVSNDPQPKYLTFQVR